MAYSQTDLSNIQAAIKSGVKKVKLDGKETEFRSLAEMRQIEQDIKDVLAGSSSRYGVTYLTKGSR